MTHMQIWTAQEKSCQFTYLISKMGKSQHLIQDNSLCNKVVLGDKNFITMIQFQDNALITEMNKSKPSETPHSVFVVCGGLGV